MDQSISEKKKETRERNKLKAQKLRIEIGIKSIELLKLSERSCVSLSGAEQIAIERARQIDNEGFTPEHDAEHVFGELVRAAQLYMTAGHLLQRAGREDTGHGSLPDQSGRQAVFDLLRMSPPGGWESWPWDREWWKPKNEAIENFRIAGALLAAEIDRIQGIQDGSAPESTDVDPVACMRAGRMPGDVGATNQPR